MREPAGDRHARGRYPSTWATTHARGRFPTTRATTHTRGRPQGIAPTMDVGFVIVVLVSGWLGVRSGQVFCLTLVEMSLKISKSSFM
jgi:hypothetical protein